MISIQSIGYYVPEHRSSNLSRCAEFGLDPSYIEEKIGVRQVAVSQADHGAFELALKAIKDLQGRAAVSLEQVDAVVVVTQTPGQNIPHVSARLHGALSLPTTCACFDLSLGCSGYLHGLMVLSALMEAQEMRTALLVTADPYSKIIDPTDKNTAMLFGDAASATLLSRTGQWSIGKFTYNTLGASCQELETRDGRFYMNGRSVFSFSAQRVPSDILRALDLNRIGIEDVDLFAIHQGSRFIVDTIRSRMGVAKEKMPFEAGDYGNTVSSSIPLLLADRMDDLSLRKILVSGFGVGLSWSSTVLTRRS